MIRVYNPETGKFENLSTWQFLDYYKIASVGSDRKALSPLQVDSGWYMNEGPGKTAAPSMFPVIRKAPEAARLLAPGVYDLADVSALLGLSKQSEKVNYAPKYLYSYDSSFDKTGNISNNLIWGSVGYTVSGKMTIGKDRSYSIKGIITPQPDKFNFDSDKKNGSFAWFVNKFNFYASNIFDTRGKVLPINFVPNAGDTLYASSKQFVVSSLPSIYRGPAPNGYDRPWGVNSSGSSFNRVSFTDDAPASSGNSRGGAGNGSFFGNDFGDVNLPGSGGVSYASAGVFTGASYAATPGGVGPYDFARGAVDALGVAASSAGDFLASGQYSAGFIPGGVGLSVNWGNATPNANLSGFGPGGHSVYLGGASANGVGFNSLADFGREAQSLVSDVKSGISEIGNFFGSAASSVGKFFRGLFSPVALDLNGDGVQLTPATEGNKFFDMATAYQKTSPRYTRDLALFVCLGLVIRISSADYAHADDFYSICTAYRANQYQLLNECFDHGKSWSYRWNGEKVELFSYVRKLQYDSHFSAGCVFQRGRGEKFIINYLGVYYSPDNHIFSNLDEFHVESLGHGGDIHISREGKSETLLPVNGFSVDEGPRHKETDGPVWKNCERGKYLKETRETIRKSGDVNIRYRVDNNQGKISIKECSQHFDLETNKPLAPPWCHPTKYAQALKELLTYEIVFSEDSLFITRDGNVFFDEHEIERACRPNEESPLGRGSSAKLCEKKLK